MRIYHDIAMPCAHDWLPGQAGLTITMQDYEVWIARAFNGKEPKAVAAFMRNGAVDQALSTLSMAPSRN